MSLVEAFSAPTEVDLTAPIARANPVAKLGVSLAVAFAYADGKRSFEWRGDLETNHAAFEADFGRGRTRLSAAVSLLPPEVALAEAMFF